MKFELLIAAILIGFAITVVLSFFVGLSIVTDAYAVIELAGPAEDIQKILDCETSRNAGTITHTVKNECITLITEYKQKCDSDLAIENVLPCKDVDGYNPMTSFLNRTTAELQSENAEINAQIDNHEFFE